MRSSTCSAGARRSSCPAWCRSPSAFLFAAAVPAEARERPAKSDAAARGDAGGNLFRLIVSLALFFIGAAIIYNALSMCLPKLFARRLTGLGGDRVLDVGSWVTANYLIAGAAQLLGGYMADRYPYRTVLIVAYAAQLPLLMLASTAAGLPLFFATAAILSATLGTQPAIDSLVAHHAPPQWRSTAYGLRFVVSITASSASVPLVGFIYDGTGGFFWVFVVLAAVAALVLSAAFLLPTTARSAARRTPATAPAE